MVQTNGHVAIGHHVINGDLGEGADNEVVVVVANNEHNFEHKQSMNIQKSLLTHTDIKEMFRQVRGTGGRGREAG